MSDDDFKALIQGYATVDLDSAYATFQHETGQESWEHFLLFLYQRQWVRPDVFDAIRTRNAAGPVATDPSAPRYEHGGTEPDHVAPGGFAPLHHDAATQIGAAPGGHGAAAAPLCAVPGTGPLRYTMLELLGEGGMGQIHVARDPVLRRRVAYKRLKADMPPEVAGRFLDEAMVTAQLEHPNIVSVYSLDGEAAHSLGYAMKLVEGKTLELLISERRVKVQSGEAIGEEHDLLTLIDHFLKVCDAIAFAHSRGVLHRDLKPANIMVGGFGEVYLMDWGICRLMRDVKVEPEHQIDLPSPQDGSEVTERTLTGQSIGTPAYMSPEQAQGRNKELDGRSDLYALGLVLQEIVCLKAAVTGNTTFEILTKAVEGKPDPVEPGVVGLSVDPWLRAIVEKSTAREPNQRYATVADFADDLRHYVRGDAIKARSDNLSRKLSRWIGRHSTTAALVALLLVAVSTGAVIWSLQARRSADARARAREVTLSGFQAAVARRAHRIDNHFLTFQNRVQALATVAAQALARGASSEEPLFSGDDYDTEGKGPDDLRASSVYEKPVSPRWPVYKLAPEVSLESAEPALRRLNPLRHLLRRVFVTPHRAGSNRAPLDPEAIDRLITELGVPVRWAYIGLDAGVMFAFPGKGGYERDFDPRERPWYQLSSGQRGPRWGAPYLDAQGQGLLMACAASIHADDGAFLGVAGLDLTVDYVVKNLLVLADGPPVGATYLVDESGAVVVSSEDAGRAAEIPTHPFPIPEVLEAVKQGRSGHLTITAPDGRPAVAAFSRLDTIGWTYVAWSPADQLFAPAK